jgi:hypothetical protein
MLKFLTGWRSNSRFPLETLQNQFSHMGDLFRDNFTSLEIIKDIQNAKVIGLT